MKFLYIWIHTISAIVKSFRRIIKYPSPLRITSKKEGTKLRRQCRTTLSFSAVLKCVSPSYIGYSQVLPIDMAVKINHVKKIFFSRNDSYYCNHGFYTCSQNWLCLSKSSDSSSTRHPLREWYSVFFRNF